MNIEKSKPGFFEKFARREKKVGFVTSFVAAAVAPAFLGITAFLAIDGMATESVLQGRRQQREEMPQAA